MRADLFCELLLTGIPSSCGDDDLFAHITAQIQVTVPALTLAGDPSGRPASLTGHGPIDPDIARRLAGLAPGWDRVFTDPYSGEVLAVNRYRPSAQIKRYLAARDERCRAPACTRPVHRCDCDHTVAAADGGPTEAETSPTSAGDITPTNTRPRGACDSSAAASSNGSAPPGAAMPTARPPSCGSSP